MTQSRFAYDPASRLQTVADGPNAATYAYLANSDLIEHIRFTNNNALRMTTTRQYDHLDRLTGISSAPSGSPVVSSAYRYNPANQRVARTNADHTYWVYQYDALGQVTAGRACWSDGLAVGGQQFEYAFDDIGNRRATAAGGDQAGANLRHATYSADNLNRYTSRTVPGFMDMLGAANSAATVTLWGSDGSYAPTTRRGDYFRGELPVTNTPGPVWLTVTNLAVLQDGTNADIVTSITREVFVPGTPEAFAYDADGNLTSDGRWMYTWDAENRVTRFESVASLPTEAKRKVLCTYDHAWRRTQKITYTNNGSAYFPAATNRYVYDGWNLIARLDGGGNVLQTYAWGLDLSGTLEGAGLSRQSGASAGGVGGLLWVTSHAAPVGSHFAACDGNGNVAGLVSAADGTPSAQYEYGPFGELLRATGPMAEANPLHFSTKYQDDETGLLYYGYRYYSATPGRWLNHDPIAEGGGLNLYTFAANEPLGSVDLRGKAKLSLTFEFGPKGGDPNEPSDAIFVNSSKDMLEAATSKVGKYDPDGKDCNCISYLVIANHGGGGGEIPMRDVVYNAATHDTNLKMQNGMSKENYEKYLAGGENRRQTAIAHDVLSQLASLKCRRIKIVILACSAGEGEMGKALRKQLADLFGPAATIVTYEEGCGFSPIFHNPAPKWDWFNNSKRKEIR